ncbi:MAG: YHS domain-containing protein, partial [Alphaproteobacteria bacterium]|nr:YHS domain-containing protein [Alphaproteobacteria bacterium]
MAIDPVCGMQVEIATSKLQADYQGTTYHFCAPSCRTKFIAAPQNYVGGAKPAPVAMPEGTIYTCPMDPQIRQVGPGVCPICGMALEPLLVTADSGPNPELLDMTRRFWIALVLTLPVFALEMGSHVMDLHSLIGPQVSNWVQLLLATPVVLWAGAPFFQRGWQSVLTRHFNMFTLIALGTGVAWAYSILATLKP